MVLMLFNLVLQRYWKRMEMFLENAWEPWRFNYYTNCKSFWSRESFISIFLSDIWSGTSPWVL